MIAGFVAPAVLLVLWSCHLQEWIDFLIFCYYIRGRDHLLKPVLMCQVAYLLFMASQHQHGLLAVLINKVEVRRV